MLKAQQLIAGFEDAEKHLAEVRADIEAYLALTGGKPSMSGLNDKLFRARRGIAEASLESRRALERALRETNSSSLEEIEGDPKYRLQWTKKIRLKANLGQSLKTSRQDFKGKR